MFTRELQETHEIVLANGRNLCTISISANRQAEIISLRMDQGMGPGMNELVNPVAVFKPMVHTARDKRLLIRMIRQRLIILIMISQSNRECATA